jgi:hypothetical protein
MLLLQLCSVKLALEPATNSQKQHFQDGQTKSLLLELNLTAGTKSYITCEAAGKTQGTKGAMIDNILFILYF